LNSFLGLPSDGGMHGLSTTRSDGDVTAERAVAEGPRGGVAAGEEVTGPDGRSAERGAAVGPDGGVAAGRGVEGADGATAGEAAVARGNGGAAAGFRYTAPSSRYTAAAGARGAFDDHGIYGTGWYGAHPGAWAPTGWAAGAAWTPASWGACGSWLGYGATAPTYYDYGNNVVIQDNSVTVNGQDAGTPREYYQQANDLATQGADAPASDDDQWMPLGVFSLVHHENATSKLTVQLAVNKQGVLRGNYTDAAKDQTQPIHGQVDKTTQRAAWTVGDNTKTVLETGLYNLTKDEAPCLIHSGADHTDQWLLVRLKQDATADAGQDSGAAGGDAGQDGTGAADDLNAGPAGDDGNPAANTDN
jgi:hypothetical protein